VIGYVDQGGRQIVQASLDLGAFDRFIFPDGMIGDSLMTSFGPELAGSFGTVPGSDSDAAARFEELASAAGIAGTGPYRAESYDGAALIALAMQAAGSADRDAIAGRILDVANAPGVRIGVGEIGEGLRILAEGGEIDYVGATDVELSPAGDAAGSFRELDVKNAQFTTVSIW
jgi:branched-chain amino acid transport system substrate-binding protein